MRRSTANMPLRSFGLQRCNGPGRSQRCRGCGFCGCPQGAQFVRMGVGLEPSQLSPPGSSQRGTQLSPWRNEKKTSRNPGPRCPRHVSPGDPPRSAGRRRPTQCQAKGHRIPGVLGRHDGSHDRRLSGNQRRVRAAPPRKGPTPLKEST